LSSGAKPQFVINHKSSPEPTCSVAKPSDDDLLTSLIKNKENNPLPPINTSVLIQPEQVIEKYPKMMKISKIPTLAIKLAKEAYFGKQIMSKCTVRGTRALHALPETELQQMKKFIKELCYPHLVVSIIEFENVWKACVEAVGQACKFLHKS